MCQHDVGANLMFALELQPESNLCSETNELVSDIGSFMVVVRRANIRFAPTLVSDIDWNSVLLRGKLHLLQRNPGSKKE
jgi:hypothetical protein